MCRYDYIHHEGEQKLLKGVVSRARGGGTGVTFLLICHCISWPRAEHTGHTCTTRRRGELALAT